MISTKRLIPLASVLKCPCCPWHDRSGVKSFAKRTNRRKVRRMLNRMLAREED